jgi:RNA polymerase sigma-70 factor (ECF subfamily)
MDDPVPFADVTRLLHEWQNGDRAALDQLVPRVYDELRAIASRHRRREWRDGAMQTTALVNEAYLKLIDQRRVDWQNRAHFFAVAAQLMRRILVDDARRHLQEKRGGGAVCMPVEDEPIAAAEGPLDAVETLALDRALSELERLDAHQARIVELRFFGGLTIEETAAALSISPMTVKREWAIAKGWLYRALTQGRGAE